MSDPEVTRRAALAGAMAAPVLALPAVAEAAPTDPAIAAVRRFLKANTACGEHRSELDFEDDERAQQLEERLDAAWWAMARTTPTTLAGFALMLQAATFGNPGFGERACFADFSTWRTEMRATWADGRDLALLAQLWSTPIAADLFAQLSSGSGARRA